MCCGLGKMWIASPKKDSQALHLAVTSGTLACRQIVIGPSSIPGFWTLFLCFFFFAFYFQILFFPLFLSCSLTPCLVYPRTNSSGRIVKTSIIETPKQGGETLGKIKRYFKNLLQNKTPWLLFPRNKKPRAGTCRLQDRQTSCDGGEGKRTT